MSRSRGDAFRRAPPYSDGSRGIPVPSRGALQLPYSHPYSRPDLCVLGKVRQSPHLSPSLPICRRREPREGYAPPQGAEARREARQPRSGIRAHAWPTSARVDTHSAVLSLLVARVRTVLSLHKTVIPPRGWRAQPCRRGRRSRRQPPEGPGPTHLALGDAPRVPLLLDAHRHQPCC